MVSYRDPSRVFPERIKDKIWSDQFIDFADLIRNEKIQPPAHVIGDISILVNHRHKSPVKSYKQWISCFHKFVAVYCRKKEPGGCPYAIRRHRGGHSRQRGGGDFIKYDEEFRKFRAMHPYPWDITFQDIYNRAFPGPTNNTSRPFHTLANLNQNQKRESLSSQPIVLLATVIYIIVGNGVVTNLVHSFTGAAAAMADTQSCGVKAEATRGTLHTEESLRTRGNQQGLTTPIIDNKLIDLLKKNSIPCTNNSIFALKFYLWFLPQYNIICPAYHSSKLYLFNRKPSRSPTKIR
jgi:hypothetical protein